MDLSTLNERQREAVKFTEGPLLVVAGAGSGKTKVLTSRIAYLIDEKKIEPWNILSLTFTNKAAEEMKSRIKLVVGELADYVWAGTFHSICSKILRIHAGELGYSQNFVIYDTTDQKSLIKSIMKTLCISDKSISPKHIRSEISRAKNCMMDPNAYLESATHDPDGERIGAVYKAYNSELKANNAMDFDDLILKTIELFKENLDILESYSEKFKYIHVDEYQDTNMMQYQLIQMLAGKHGNICVVGDQDQSIYSWRGADIRNIKEFESDFSGAKTILLEQNYRSTKNILDLANAVISNNEDRIEKKLWTDNALGDKASYFCAKSEEDEARYVARTIMDGVNSGRDFSDFAIMYRTNAQSRDFERFFAINNIPYKIVGGLKFYDRKEIKDILSYLRVILNPDDRVAAFRIINEPRRGIGAKTIERITRYAEINSLGFMDSIRESLEEKLFKGKIFKGLSEFYALIGSCSEMMDNSPPSDIVKHILTATSYTASLLEAKTPEARAKLENIEELISHIMNREAENPDYTLAEYLQETSLVSDQDDIDSDERGNVLLMTFHSAKGLEFPEVFMVGMEETIFPSYYTEDRDMEEERRLCYVGITRAISKLHVTHAEMRFRFGRHQVNRPSIFLEEMPEDLLERISPIKREYVKNDGPVARVKKVESSRPKKVLDSSEIMLGTKVKHKMFGKGVVIRMNPRNGDTEVLIAFDNKGLKTMMLSMAPIEIIS